MNAARTPHAPGIGLQGRDDAAIAAQLQRLGLQLSAPAVRELHRKLEREPTAAELALLNSMWSEHCSYKSTRALLGGLPTVGPHVVLGPGSDAGVVRLPRLDQAGRVNWSDIGAGGPALCLVVGHESHNHPSQLLPYEGAATGIGGIVRDVYCMGAEVIGLLDALRFGDVDGAEAETVRLIARGVIAGVAGYGNALGVPNMGGEIEFDACFDDNCLVNVVALGLVPEDRVVPSRLTQAAQHGYVLVLVGKPTDDSGLGGAAFASGLLDGAAGSEMQGAVQLPDPFFKRVLTEANRAVLEFLHRSGAAFAMKDLGAAGLGGASSEIAGPLGLDIDLDCVHTDRPGRAPAVILVAETQERYVLAIPADLAGEVCRIYEQDFELGKMVQRAGARVIGHFDASGRYRAHSDTQLHCDLPTLLITAPHALHWPRATRQPVFDDIEATFSGRDFEQDLMAMLYSPGGASRFPVFGHYDSDVQGRTVTRPGEADAGVLLVDRASPLGIAVGIGSVPRLGVRDAYRAGATAVCEAVRNVVAVGATPWALTDCLNFGSPEVPEVMQDLEDAVRGLADAARTLGLRGHDGVSLPFVSGNVSLYNASRAGRAIPPTPIVACFGVLGDVGAARVCDLDAPGNLLFRLGKPSTRLGGSLFAQATRQTALLARGALPVLDLAEQRQLVHAVLDAFDRGLVAACHDVGAGGDVLALIEMAFGRSGEVRAGIVWRVDPGPADWREGAFAEAPGFWCSVRPEHRDEFEACVAKFEVFARCRGVVIAAPQLRIEQAGETQLQLDLAQLARRWRSGLVDVLHSEVLG